MINAILLAIQTYRNGRKEKPNVHIELKLDNKIRAVITQESEDFLEIPTNFWSITVRNRDEKAIILESFWLSVLYNDEEYQLFEPITDEFLHRDGIIKFPYSLSVGEKLPISLNLDFFNPYLINDEPKKISFPEFSPIAYFTDQMGNTYNSTQYRLL